MNQSNKMGTMPMPNLVINMSLPLMLSLLVQSLYNIVDSIFVARIGENALTAVSLAYPIQLLMIAVSVGTSVGVNALLAQSIGAKHEEATKNIATTGMMLSLAGMVVFLILGLTCTGLFVRMFTEDEAIGAWCRQYLFICMIFCGGTFISTMFQRFLQSVGDTFDSMISLVSGAVTNLILDPIMIFGLFGCPALGIRGAAIATVIGQWVSAAVAVILNTVKNPIVKVGIKGYRIDRTVLYNIYKVGLPTIVTQALGSVMLSAVNAILISFSSTAVAFFGVYYKLQNFLFMPMNGLGQAAIPIVGYSYGAKRPGRIVELLKTILPLAIGIAVIITIIFMAIPSPLLQIFSASEQMLEIGVPALRIISVTFAFGAVTIILGYSMSGLGNGVVNMLGTALRQVIVLVPCIWLFSKLFGVEYAWYAFWISEAAGCLYAALASRHELKKKGITGKNAGD
ncbi:MAG: MATE family efflux transporter [Lachnospiraceae bacterium]|nr:MATE family efflux transporter [Lachnospiraceae bacterium]